MKSFSNSSLQGLISASDATLSLRKQCDLLGVNRSSYYYQPQGETEANLLLMAAIDRHHLAHPCWGYPRMTDALRADFGQAINHKRVHRLMRLMRIRSVLPAPDTSQPNKTHKIYPYLLNDLVINRPNQVWATDITYIPMAKGFMYLVAVMDWHSRFVLSWQLSSSMEVSFCLEALEEAWKFGQPQVFNSDQGAQFTSLPFTSSLLEKDIRISMDGKGRALDNRFVERLWWTLKYEHIFLHAYENGKSLYLGIKAFFHYYNYQRQHSSLDKRTPAAVFLNQ
jgi:putative transposase